MRILSRLLAAVFVGLLATSLTSVPASAATPRPAVRYVIAIRHRHVHTEVDCWHHAKPHWRECGHHGSITSTGDPGFIVHKPGRFTWMRRKSFAIYVHNGDHFRQAFLLHFSCRRTLPLYRLHHGKNYHLYVAEGFAY